MDSPVDIRAAGAMTVHIAQERALRTVPEGLDCWAYLGENPEWGIAAERELLKAVARRPTHDALQRHAVDLRGPYLDWIADLGLHNDSPEWWASELAAKNVFAFLFQRLCAVAAAAEILADRQLLVCTSRATAETVARVARGRGLEVDLQVETRDRRLVATEFAHRAFHGIPAPRPPRAAPLIDDTVLATWVDGRSFDTAGNYHDPHFGPLADLLRGRGETVSLLARILPSANRRDTVRRLTATDEHVYFPDAFVTVADWRDCWRRARSFTPEVPSDARVGDVPAAALAAEVLATNRVSHAGALTYAVLVRRLAAYGARPARIVVPWEGHAWETALFGAVRTHLPETELIAYDNLNFSSLALSLYPGEAELSVRPLPDRVVTNGPTFASILARSGFPPERIRVGCALRHRHVYDTPRATPPKPEDVPFVLAAGSIDAGQTIEMIDAASAAFGRELLVKLHPASDVDRIRRSVPDDVRFDVRPLPELLPSARAMVYTYSIVPYEALAAGVPPLFFRSQSLLDLDQLEPTPDVRWVGATPEDLRVALAAGEAAAAGKAWRERAREALQAALAPPSDACAAAFLAPRGDDEDE